MMSYTVSRDSDGVYIITPSSGAPFAEDPTDGRYAEFLHWLSDHPEAERGNFAGRLEGDSHYFGDMGQLVEHLKKRQILLYVTHDDTPDSGRVHRVGRDRLGITWYDRLPKAAVRGDDPDSDRLAGGGDGRSGLAPESSRCYVTADLLGRIDEGLAKSPTEPIRRLSSWPIVRSFVYIDVSDFSRALSGHQALVIRAIISLVTDDGLWRKAYDKAPGVNRMEAMLCIGDGYIFVFDDTVKAAYFAAYLAQLIEASIAARRIIPFHFRMGVHVGPVLNFWDPGRNAWNYTGEGINGGNRVIGAIGKDADDIVFISDAVRKSLIGLRAHICRVLLLNTQNRGRRADKHGNLWRVYELNHAGVAGLDMPDELAGV